MDELKAKNFIEDIIINDLKSGKHQEIYTRFPPEPNGYLHIGHAKSLSINFGAKEKFKGKCNLRFDDTNPIKEDDEYVQAIKEDIEWLGYKWDKELHASDYFEFMYECAIKLIKKGLAFVCDMSAEEMSRSRGTLTEGGIESPWRNRGIEENLELFEKMRQGCYQDGEKTLRAKIDMASPNMNMRDPALYRILRASHHRTKDDWLIYPMYDFAHPLEDAIEGITHSLCSLEFEDHRPLYNWVRDHCGYENGPRQIEFARLNLTRTIMSKRYLKKLVDEKLVEGWDDPRLPTLCGMRKRGYTPDAIKDFCERIGVAKANSLVDIKLLEHCVREDLNEHAVRVMVVKNPLKLTILNLEEDKVFRVDNHPAQHELGSREMVLSKEIYIEREDFEVLPPPKYYRLKPQGIVRLRGAYILEYVNHILDDNGHVVEVQCNYIPDSQTGGSNASIRCKGVIHWVSKDKAIDVILNEYDYLLDDEEDKGFEERIVKDSKNVVNAKAEPYLGKVEALTRFQFMRLGYYILLDEMKDGKRVFNSIVGLKDSYKPKR